MPSWQIWAIAALTETVLKNIKTRADVWKAQVNFSTIHPKGKHRWQCFLWWNVSELSRKSSECPRKSLNVGSDTPTSKILALGRIRKKPKAFIESQFYTVHQDLRASRIIKAQLLVSHYKSNLLWECLWMDTKIKKSLLRYNAKKQPTCISSWKQKKFHIFCPKQPRTEPKTQLWVKDARSSSTVIQTHPSGAEMLREKITEETGERWLAGHLPCSFIRRYLEDVAGNVTGFKKWHNFGCKIGNNNLFFVVDKGQLLIVPLEDASSLTQLISVFLKRKMAVHIDSFFSFSFLLISGMCRLIH